ncbi:tRNA1(Val) (adenine(37)-N6)-methyltransferase [Anaerotruncus rubiinfantis]|uniref:tRNA1(Val) (adenine(37)-N6)-methyltransferase n=1 Tax=Anaerotruncus rubiinfantis TaxID=1720200 RepID=UPI000836C923|nr:methyltransferase [Anaerotruncus rubiinfantis]
MLLFKDTFEPLGERIKLCVTPQHKFGTDAFLLSDFAAPRRKDLACDLGAGCGIVGALWFRDEKTAPRKVCAVEVQEQAVAQMQRSVAVGGLPADRFFPVRADLRDLSGVLDAGMFDLVTCNPPYKTAGTGILSESESDRIARHETLCEIGDICAAAARLLRFGGRLCLCHRPERLVDVACAMRKAGIEPKRLRMVHQRPGCAPWLLLIEGKRGAKPFLQVEAPLIIEGPGGFSQEVLRIYQKEANL